MMPVPITLANAANINAVRAQFSTLKSLGFNTVAQSFAGNTSAYDWLAYLQVAEQENLAVIAAFTETPLTWQDSHFELGIREAFLRVAQNQAAFYALVVAHDPFNPKHGGMFTTERLRVLYQQIKIVAPAARVLVLYQDSLGKPELTNNPNTIFKSGQCDVCVITGCAFRNTGDGNRFRRDTLLAQQRLARTVIKREDPRAQLWTTAQVLGATTRLPQDETSWYYMPAPDELQQMVDVLWSAELQQRGKLDGVIWAEWAWDWQSRPIIQGTLGSPEYGAQREWVKNFSKRLGIVPP